MRWHEANRLASWDIKDGLPNPTGKQGRQGRAADQRSRQQQQQQVILQREPGREAGTLSDSPPASPATSSHAGIFPDDDTPTRAGLHRQQLENAATANACSSQQDLQQSRLAAGTVQRMTHQQGQQSASPASGPWTTLDESSGPAGPHPLMTHRPASAAQLPVWIEQATDQPVPSNASGSVRSLQSYAATGTQASLQEIAWQQAAQPGLPQELLPGSHQYVQNGMSAHPDMMHQAGWHHAAQPGLLQGSAPSTPEDGQQGMGEHGETNQAAWHRTGELDGATFQPAHPGNASQPNTMPDLAGPGMLQSHIGGTTSLQHRAAAAAAGPVAGRAGGERFSGQRGQSIHPWPILPTHGAFASQHAAALRTDSAGTKPEWQPASGLRASRESGDAKPWWQQHNGRAQPPADPGTGHVPKHQSQGHAQHGWNGSRENDAQVRNQPAASSIPKHPLSSPAPPRAAEREPLAPISLNSDPLQATAAYSLPSSNQAPPQQGVLGWQAPSLAAHPAAPSSSWGSNAHQQYAVPEMWASGLNQGPMASQDWGHHSQQQQQQPIREAWVSKLDQVELSSQQTASDGWKGGLTQAGLSCEQQQLQPPLETGAYRLTGTAVSSQQQQYNSAGLQQQSAYAQHLLDLKKMGGGWKAHGATNTTEMPDVTLGPAGQEQSQKHGGISAYAHKAAAKDPQVSCSPGASDLAGGRSQAGRLLDRRLQPEPLLVQANPDQAPPAASVVHVSSLLLNETRVPKPLGQSQPR